jgi:outer membrane protein OmpA-like peptidoglycan-associated protein
MLSWLAVNAESDRIEGDLEQRSAAALAGAGHDWASVAFSGRDGLLVGTPHRQGQREEAVALVSDVWGVRAVEARELSAGDSASPDAVPAHEEIPHLPLRDLAPVDLPMATSEVVATRVVAGPVVGAEDPGGVVQARARPDALVGARDERIAEASHAQSEPTDVVQAREVTPADGIEAPADAAPMPEASLKLPAPSAPEQIEEQAGLSAVTEQKHAEALTAAPAPQQEATAIPAADPANDPAVVARADDTPPPPERKEVAEARPALQPQEAISIPAADPAGDPAVVAKIDDTPPPPERKEVAEARPAAQPQEAISIPAADPATDPAVVAKVDASLSGEPTAAAPELPVAKPEQPSQIPPLPAPKSDRDAGHIPPIPQAKADPAKPASAPATGTELKPPPPDHRFDTAALPQGNSASDGDCTGAVQAAARQVEVHFARGHAHLDRAGKTAVDRLVGALNACPATALSIAGHADASGHARRNLALSKRRARGVTAYLVDKGIDASRLAAVGYGDTQPVAPNDTRANRAKNRRIEVVITARRVPPPPMPVRKQDAHNGLSRR